MYAPWKETRPDVEGHVVCGETSGRRRYGGRRRLWKMFHVKRGGIIFFIWPQG